MGVAIFHFLIPPAMKLPPLKTTIDIVGNGPLSVDMFFTLSGFLIGGILLQLKEAPDFYKTFYMRRATRILPLYYLWVLFYCVLFLASRSTPPHGMSRMLYLSSFFLFIQSFYPAILIHNVIMLPTWSLVAEEYFYLVIPVCIRRLTSRQLVLALAGVLIATPILRLLLLTHLGWQAEWVHFAVFYWAPCHADALAMGVILAALWRLPQLRAWLQGHASLFVWGALAATGLVFLFSDIGGAKVPKAHLLDASIGLSCQEFAGLCMIVYLICRPDSTFGRFLSSKTMRRLGRISYCVYIIHCGVLWMIFQYVLRRPIGGNPWLGLLVAPIALLLTVALAQLSWMYFERPLLRWAHGKRKSSHPFAVPGRRLDNLKFGIS